MNRSTIIVVIGASLERGQERRVANDRSTELCWQVTTPRRRDELRDRWA
jgi:hypothetical protein